MNSPAMKPASMIMTEEKAIRNAMIRADMLAAQNTHGGPFGSVILAADGSILGEGRNEVVHNHDPSCHAEMQALRDAGKNQGFWHLKGATLVTSCECCPMCLAGAYAAGVERIIFGNTRKDAANIGFADDAIYEEMSVDFRTLPIERIASSEHLTNADAAVIDAQGKVLATAKAVQGNVDDPTAIPSVIAIGKACAAVDNFHLPEGCTLITRKTVHPLGYTAARWAHIAHIHCLDTFSWEGAERSRHHPELIYLDIALPMTHMQQRRIPMEQFEHHETLQQTLATFGKWFNDQNKVLY
ncbi:MAG: nucleoside deaminase [Alphaproteobacteria bacterium]|nr:nucleoside deaminase [Alphaproteobacteria bacterium]